MGQKQQHQGKSMRDRSSDVDQDDPRYVRIKKGFLQLIMLMLFLSAVAVVCYVTGWFTFHQSEFDIIVVSCLVFGNLLVCYQSKVDME